MKKAAEYYDGIARQYDELANSSEFNWRSPYVVFSTIAEYLAQGDKVLDLGIGTGLSSELPRMFGAEIYGVDSSIAMLVECAKKNLAKALIKADLDIESIPFSNNYFRMVIADGLIPFIRDVEGLIREIHRVLHAHGILAFTFEGPQGNEHKDYVERDGLWVDASVLERTEVIVYRRDPEEIKSLLADLKFQLLKQVHFQAYTSPSTGKDTYFTALVAKKLATNHVLKPQTQILRGEPFF